MHRALDLNMGISLDDWEKEYKAGVSRKGQKWHDKTLAATGVLEKARSEEAEARYATGVQRAATNKLRQKALQNVTEADLKEPIRAGGPGLYSNAAQAKASKARRRFQKYASVIDNTVAGLAAKGDDPEANVDARVKPLVRALHNAKIGGGS